MKSTSITWTKCLVGLFVLLVGANCLCAEVPADLLEKARNGDAEAMDEVGLHYFVDKRYDEAFPWTQKAADKGNAAAQAGLGFMYFNGFGCAKDLAKARELYEKSAKGGAHQGINNLAHLYRHGLAGLPKDQAKAEKLLIQAAELGNECAVMTLSQVYKDGEFGPPKPKEALRWLEFGAKKEFAGCFVGLGFFYEHGVGVEVDLPKAVGHFKRAAELGSALGMSNLGYLYMKGEGVGKDYRKAEEWFAKAAEQGNPGALINLAVMKIEGLGCDPDKQAAREWLKKAVEAGGDTAATAAEMLEALNGQDVAPGASDPNPSRPAPTSPH